MRILNSFRLILIILIMISLIMISWCFPFGTSISQFGNNGPTTRVLLEKSLTNEEKLMIECKNVLGIYFLTGPFDGMKNFENAYLNMSLQKIDSLFQLDNQRVPKIVFIKGYFSRLFNCHKLTFNKMDLPGEWCKGKAESVIENYNSFFPSDILSLNELISKCLEYTVEKLLGNKSEILQNEIFTHFYFTLSLDDISYESFTGKPSPEVLGQSMQIKQTIFFITHFSRAYFKQFIYEIEDVKYCGLSKPIEHCIGEYLSVEDYCRK